jgi:predicted nucleic acid-binding Zn ribbon protein
MPCKAGTVILTTLAVMLRGSAMYLTGMKKSGTVGSEMKYMLD